MHNLHIDWDSTAILISDTLLAIGSYNGCFLICNQTKSSRQIHQLDDKPVNTLIHDRKNKLGVLYENAVDVYDIKLKQKILSQFIYCKNYSAAFDHINSDLLIYQDGSITRNKEIIRTVPQVTQLNKPSISCHPSQYYFLYPCSETTLSFSSFTTNDTEFFHPAIPENENICKAFFNCTGTSIAIKTNRKWYIYSPSTKTTTPIDDVSIGFTFFHPAYNYLVSIPNLRTTCQYNPEKKILFSDLFPNISLFFEVEISKEIIDFMQKMDVSFATNKDHRLSVNYKHLMLLYAHKEHPLNVDIIKIIINYLSCLKCLYWPLDLFRRE